MNWTAVPPASPLELLHPAGAVGRVLLLGEACPRALLPHGAAAVEEDAELVVIAPSRAELRRRGWLDRAVADGVRALAPEGLAYALLPRGRRAAVARRLRATGLALEPAVVQLAEGGTPRYLVPLAAGPWRYAMEEQIGARPTARRWLAALGTAEAGRSLLALALPAVAVVARRPDAPPRASWVGGLEGEVQDVADATAATSWRGPSGPVVITCFGRGEAVPWGVAKVGPDSLGEAERLRDLGDAARAAGARVPRLLGAGRAGVRPVLVQTVVAGQAAATALGHNPRRFGDVAGAIAAWLERWNAATVTRAPARDRLEKELLEPADELSDELPEGYRAWLAERTARAAGELPVVARHNDLTMWNVRLDADEAIGVLDWAEADTGLPLTDLYYAVADAAAARDGYRDRVAALQDALSTIAPLRERLTASMELSAGTAELAFHACWLRHAGNQRRMDGDGQFVEILRWVARRALEEPS